MNSKLTAITVGAIGGVLGTIVGFILLSGKAEQPQPVMVLPEGVMMYQELINLYSVTCVDGQLHYLVEENPIFTMPVGRQVVRCK